MYNQTSQESPPSKRSVRWRGSFLDNTSIRSLDKLTAVKGYLSIEHVPIKSLNNLKFVGWGLFLENSLIEDLGNLEQVNGHLYLKNTPLSKQFSTKDELRKYIRNKIKVKGRIYA